MVRLTREVPVPSHVVRYVADLVVATHDPAVELVERYVRVGSSPRGAQALMLAAKAHALVDGRPSVALDDVRAVAHPALRHRVALGFEAAVDGIGPDAVIDGVLAAVPVPERAAG